MKGVAPVGAYHVSNHYLRENSGFASGFAERDSSDPTDLSGPYHLVKAAASPTMSHVSNPYLHGKEVRDGRYIGAKRLPRLDARN
jgi:hypothetical protein